MNQKHFSSQTVILIAALVAAGKVMAGGYFVGEQGARSAGRGGAFTAKADDPSAVELNPAGLARQRGTTIYLGNRFAHVSEYFTRAPTLNWGSTAGGVPPYVEFDAVGNDENWQFLNPALIASTDFGLENWGFALGVYTPPGVSSAKFPENGGQRYMMVDRDVKILNYTASLAWKHADKFGIGATLQWLDLASLRFKLIADGAIFSTTANPVSSNFDISATLKGADHFTMTGIIGAWFKPNANFEIALSGRIIPVTMRAESVLNVAFTQQNMQSETIRLFRDGNETDDVTLSLPLPAAIKIGGRYIHLNNGKELWDVELDIGLEGWSYVKRFEMNGDGLMAEAIGQSFSVDRLVMEKQWQNVYTFHLGGDLHLVPDVLTLRSGVFFETPAAKKAYANVDFFSSHQIGGSLGASVMFADFELALSYTYLYQVPFDIGEGEGKVYQQLPGSACAPPFGPKNCDPHYLGQPGPTINGGTYSAEYHFLSATAMYTF